MDDILYVSDDSPHCSDFSSMAELSFGRSPLAELIGFNAGLASLLGFLIVQIGISMQPLFVETLVML